VGEELSSLSAGDAQLGRIHREIIELLWKIGEMRMGKGG